MSLDWAGYRRLRPGRIHLFCPRCHRKTSNARRDRYDPQRAELVHSFCERCGSGGKDSPETFFDTQGKMIGRVEMEREFERVFKAEAREPKGAGNGR